MKILYDLSYSQNPKFYSGLYEHGKKIFIEIMKNHPEAAVTLLLLKNGKMDDYVLKLAKKIEYIDALLNTKKYFKEIERISANYDRLYLPYQPTNHKYKLNKNVEFYFTIHDLCQLDLAKNTKINKYEKYYMEGLSAHLKYTLKQILRITGAWYRRIKNQLGVNIKRANKIIVISESTKNDVINTYDIDENKLVKFLSPIKENVVDDSSGLEYKDYFLFVSSSRYNKNTISGLLALDKIWDENPDFPKAISAGRLPNKVLNIIKHKDKIISLDYVSNVDLDYLYKNALALIFPTLCEGFGMPPLEAMKFGTRVICSNIPCLKEFYNKALFFDPYNIDDIKEKILNYNTISKENMLINYSELKSHCKLDLIGESDFLVKEK